MPEPENIAIEIPVAAEIRAVATKLRMPYDHVRGIVAASATPRLLELVQGRVGEIVNEWVDDQLAVARTTKGVGHYLVHPVIPAPEA